MYGRLRHQLFISCLGQGGVLSVRSGGREERRNGGVEAWRHGGMNELRGGRERVEEEREGKDSLEGRRRE